MVCHVEKHSGLLLRYGNATGVKQELLREATEIKVNGSFTPNANVRVGIAGEVFMSAVKMISDGTIKMDAGSLFGSLPKVAWEQAVIVDRRNRIFLGLNCLLIQIGENNILIDAGAGATEADRVEDWVIGPSRLMKALKLCGLGPKDISHIVLTHLHFDHCGGCVHLDRAGELVPRFPKAAYYVQRSCLEDAKNPNERSYLMKRDNVTPIQNRVEPLDGDAEIVPGLNVIQTDGHTKGHQMVMFSYGGERILFLGDLIPTPHHLNLGVISAFDSTPDETLAMKRDVLADAEKSGWLLAFSHGHEIKAGYLERRSGETLLKPVEI